MKRRIHRRSASYCHIAVMLPVIIGVAVLMYLSGRGAGIGAVSAEAGEAVNPADAREVVFVLDISGSMFETDPDNQLKRAVEDSIRKL